MLEILVSGQTHPLFKVDWAVTPFLKIDAEKRARFARISAVGSEAHADQLLAVFAELDVPKFSTIIRGDRAATVHALIDTAAYDFDLSGETPWTIEALARFAPTTKSWVNRFGHQVSFDRCVTDLLERPLGHGVCAGTHDLIGLAVLLQVHDTHPILTPTIYADCRKRLIAARDALRQRQYPDGGWGPEWAKPILSDSDLVTECRASWKLEARIQATGHHLEWQLRAPADCRLYSSQLDKAALWGLAELERASAATVHAQICPYSHLFRAVRDWHGLEMEPMDR